MKILVSSFHANLFVAELAERTVGHSRVETALEICRETHEHFIAELTPAAEILRTIAGVKGHVEPFDLQRSVGGRDISLGENLHNSQHLFKPMEMIQRGDKEILTDSVIAAWHHIDPLAVARLLLIQGKLDEELNCALKAVRRGAIVLRQRCLRISWFGEVVLQNLLPVAQQGARC